MARPFRCRRDRKRNGQGALIGIAVLAVGFWIWDKVVPADLWGEICRGNQAIAILAAGMAISIALIISAAIQG